jgi:hypothetical protein
MAQYKADASVQPMNSFVVSQDSQAPAGGSSDPSTSDTGGQTSSTGPGQKTISVSQNQQNIANAEFILPTISAGLSAANAILLPMWNTIAAVLEVVKEKMAAEAAAAQSLPVGSEASKKVAIRSWLPMRTFRIVTMINSTVTSATGLILPASGKNSSVPRIASAGVTLMRNLVGVCFLLTSEVYFTEKQEKTYQVIKLLADTTNFALDTWGYAEQDKNMDSQNNDSTCIGLGTTAMVLNYIGSISGAATFYLYNKGDYEDGTATLALMIATKAESGIFQMSRFGYMVDHKYVPTVARGDAGD